MATYSAEVSWHRGEQVFLDNRYSRRHRIRFDGGSEMPGSASPHVVPAPMSDAAAVDPEEMFIASLSSCHMLWFLSIAAEQGFRVDHYRDVASGVMTRDARNRVSMTQVTLRPEVRFSGSPQPTRAQIEALHHQAHDACYIANSVRSEVRCEPVYPSAAGTSS